MILVFKTAPHPDQSEDAPFDNHADARPNYRRQRTRAV